MGKIAGKIPDKYTHCHYCENEFTSRHELLITDTWPERWPTRDHFIPISKSGSRTQSENIYIVCQLCNTLKGNFLPDEFVYWLACKVRWKEYPSIGGFTYNPELLEVIKKNVSGIFNGKIELDEKKIPLKRKVTKPIESISTSGVHYVCYLGKECPCVGFVNRALNGGVKQYQNVYYHSGEEKYVFIVAGGVIAYYKKSIQEYVKPFFPEKEVIPKVYAETLDDIVKRKLSEPAENFHY